MRLIATYRNAGFEALADGAVAFFDRRSDLQRRGVAFGGESAGDGQGPGDSSDRYMTSVSMRRVVNDDAVSKCIGRHALPCSARVTLT